MLENQIEENLGLPAPPLQNPPHPNIPQNNNIINPTLDIPNIFNCSFPNCSNNRGKGYTSWKGVLDHTKNLHILTINPAFFGQYLEYMDHLVQLFNTTSSFFCFKCGSINSQRSACNCKIHPLNNRIIDADNPYAGAAAANNVTFHNLSTNNLLHREVLGHFAEFIAAPALIIPAIAAAEVFSPIPLDTPENVEAVFMTISTARIPTTKAVPKAAKHIFTRLATEILNQLVESPDNINLWAMHSALPKLVLQRLPRVPNQKRQKKRFNQDRSIINRCEILLAKDATNVRTLWNKVFSPNAIPQILPQQSQKKINEKRANILLGEGQLGNALKALVSSGIADSSEATVNNFRA